jgi:hypothetical protein
MRALPEALEVIFEVQCKRSNEKITRKIFTINKMIFFLSLWGPSIFKPHKFLISHSFQTI